MQVMFGVVYDPSRVVLIIQAPLLMVVGTPSAFC